MLRKLLYRNFIVLHRISRGFRYRFSDTGLLILSALVTAAVFGLDTRQTHAYQIFTFLLILILIAFAAVYFRRTGFNVYRKLPDYSTIGCPVTYSIIIENTGNNDFSDLTIIDELTNTAPSYGEFVNYKDDTEKHMNLFDKIVGYPRLTALIKKKRGADITPEIIDHLAKKDIVEKNLAFTPLRRGYLYFGKTILAVTDPLGLARKPVRCGNKQSLLVLPKIYRMPPLTLPGNRRYHQGGINLASTIGESGDFHSLREYRHGDPMRKIHWRTYAKKGEPVVKEFHDEYFSRTGLILDTFLNTQNEEVFEEAVSIATSIVLAYKRQESLLDLMFIKDKAYRATAGRGLGNESDLVEILACVDPEPTDRIHDLQQLVLLHSNETSSFVCVLLDWDEARKQLIRELRCRGICVLIILIVEKADTAFNDFDCMSDKTEDFWILEAGNIQASLDTLAKIQ